MTDVFYMRYGCLLRSSLLTAMAITVLSSVSAEAGWFDGCMGGKCPVPASEIFDPQAQLLITQLSLHPELMNLDYLKYHIGRPENERAEQNNLNHNYCWYDVNHQIQYQLEQKQSSPGQVVESVMSIRLDGMAVTFETLQSLFADKPSKRFFDNNSHPSQMYALAPDTLLTFSSQPNTFRVNRAKVMYRGAPLPPPSADDIAAGESQLLSASKGFSLTDQVTSETIPMLQARVKTRPYDPESHLMLAQALQRQSRLHEAIGEYKVALAMSGQDENVRAASMDALRSMHVIQDLDNMPPRRDLQFINHGQRLRAHGIQSEADQAAAAVPQ